MTRYVVANRRAGRFRQHDKEASRESAARAVRMLSNFSDVVGVTEPKDSSARVVAVLDGPPEVIAERTADLGPDVIVEREVLRYPTLALPLDLEASAREPAFVPPGAVTGTFRVTLRGSGQPLDDAEVLLFVRMPGGRTGNLVARTDASGIAAFLFPTYWVPNVLLVVPRAQFWPVILRGPQDGAVIDVPELPAVDDAVWWRAILGAGAAGAGTGNGVRVGVIDTGFGPHPYLQHVQGVGAFIDGNVDRAPAAATDVDQHGSHVTGIIGARPGGGPGASGIAPDAALFVARVFASSDAGANQGDLANAIDDLSRDHAADLINMSLGGGQPSEIERDAIQDAAERGTLCVCAAGNSAGPVEFPAAFPQVVAVSAVGLAGWAPPMSLSASRYPDSSDRFGDQQLFLANFSCFGPQIAAAAPGVGIISTVPGPGASPLFAAMDGTSMASPAACGALAALLSSSGEYLALPRTLDRAEFARRVLRAACRDIGLKEQYAGRGLPSLVLPNPYG